MIEDITYTREGIVYRDCKSRWWWFEICTQNSAALKTVPTSRELSYCLMNIMTTWITKHSCACLPESSKINSFKNHLIMYTPHLTLNHSLTRKKCIVSEQRVSNDIQSNALMQNRQHLYVYSMVLLISIISHIVPHFAQIFACLSQTCWGLRAQREGGTWLWWPSCWRHWLRSWSHPKCPWYPRSQICGWPSLWRVSFPLKPILWLLDTASQTSLKHRLKYLILFDFALGQQFRCAALRREIARGTLMSKAISEGISVFLNFEVLYADQTVC